MKKLILITAVIVLIGLPFHVGCTNYKNKEITLIQFNVTIQPEIKKYLYQLEDNFPPLKNEKADRIIGRIKDYAWSALQDKLQQQIGMIVMPLNTLGDRISYDVYDFPDVGISKAQKKGASKFYMKVDLQIGPEIFQYTTHTSSKDKKDSLPQYTRLKEGEIKPMITITLTTYPNSGILPLDKFVGTTAAPSIWAVNASILDGLVNTNNKNDQSTLMSLTQKAIDELVISILTD